MPVIKSTFDLDNNVTLFAVSNSSNDLTVEILDYGATIRAVLFADRNQVVRDLVLGYDNLDGYKGIPLKNSYFGASVGRVANRIGNAHFQLNGQSYNLCANNGVNSLHGGPGGFDKQKWSLVEEGDNYVTLQYISCDGEEGYPGQLEVKIKFTVTEQNELKIDYRAKLAADAGNKTVVNLTNHSYFNLNGVFNCDVSKVLNHLVRMESSKYLQVDDNLIPTGSIVPVKGTLFDFHQNSYTIGDRTNDVKPSGYDHCYVNEDNPENYRINPEQLKKSVQVYSPITGIRMSFFTTEPGFQFYAGSKIADGHKPKRSQSLDNSVVVGPYSGFCLEAQRFPDAINKEQWKAQVVLSNEQEYKQTTVYKFELSNNI